MSLSSLALPFLRLMDPEQAHQATLLALKAGLGSCGKKDPEALGIDLLGMHFPNPLGIAAGFDKNGEVPDAMLKLGFGFAEVGTTTPRPQSGNPKPRIFRLQQDRAVINRLGFNNEGHEAMEARLKKRAGRGGIVGVNLGANKDTEDKAADYVTGIWMGYDDNTPLSGVTGGGLPAEIWHEVMVRVLEGQPPHPLPMSDPVAGTQMVGGEFPTSGGQGETRKGGSFMDRLVRDIFGGGKSKDGSATKVPAAEDR